MGTPLQGYRKTQAVAAGMWFRKPTVRVLASQRSQAWRSGCKHRKQSMRGWVFPRERYAAVILIA